MIPFWMTAALLAAAAAPVRAPQPPDPIEGVHSFWQPIEVAPARGVAYFVTPAERADNAVEFYMLAVYRDVASSPDIGMRGVGFDKELFYFLGDCGSRTMLRTGYRFQTGNGPVPLTVSPVQMAAVPSKGSPEALALEAVCRVPQNSMMIAPADSIRNPYAWAKQRLSQKRP